VHFRAAAWAPIAGFWADKTLTGVELIVVDARAFRAVRTAVELLVAIRKTSPAALSIRNPAALDRDWGTDSLRRGLTGGLDVEDILALWEPATHAFEAVRARYLLYS
jgi:uncharacterized protein YbbC (DUF1343 family)